MSHRILLASWLCLAGVSNAMKNQWNCGIQRANDDPPSTVFLEALNQTAVDHLCEGPIGTGTAGVAGGNIQGFSLWGTSPMGITRSAADCKSAFGTLLDQCVKTQHWGGNTTFNNQIYYLKNIVYPDNPLTEGEHAAKPPPKITSLGTPPPQAGALGCEDFNFEDLKSGKAWDQAGTTGELNRLIDQGPFDDGDNRLDLVASRLFGGPANFRCGIQDSGCSIGQCSDASSPAGYMILQSLANFHSLFNTMHEGLQTSATEFDVFSIVDEFIPAKKPRDNTAIKLIFDAVLGSLGIFNAAFAKALTELKSIKKVGDATAADLSFAGAVTTTLMTGSFGVARDKMPASEQDLMALGDVSAVFHELLRRTYDGLEEFSKALVTKGESTANSVPDFAFPDDIQDGKVYVSMKKVLDKGVFLQAPGLNNDVQYFKDLYNRMFNGAIIAQIWNPMDDNDYPQGIVEEVTVPANKESVYQKIGKDMNGRKYAVVEWDTQKTLPASWKLNGDKASFGGVSIDDIITSQIQCQQLSVHHNPPISLNSPNRLTAAKLAFHWDGTGVLSSAPFIFDIRTPCFFNFGQVPSLITLEAS